MRDDRESLEAILRDLEHADRRLREAALEATIQFASRDAVPRLREIAAATADASERKALLEAADYLELPSFTEIRDQLRRQGEPR